MFNREVGFGYNHASWADVVLKLIDASEKSKQQNDSGTRSKKQKLSTPVLAEIYVSSLLIAGASETMKQLLQGTLKDAEKLQKEVSIELDKEDVYLFEDILKFCYGVKLAHTSFTELLRIIQLSDKFGFTIVIEEATKSLNIEEMTADSYCKFLESIEKVAHIPICNKLVEDSRKHIEVEFLILDKIFETSQKEKDTENVMLEKWKKLPVKGVQMVLSSDVLQVSCENTVFRALEAWVAADPDTRKEHVPALLPLIRFPLCDVNFVLDVVKRSPYVDARVFEPLLLEALEHFASCEERHTLFPVATPATKRLVKRAGYKDVQSAQMTIVNWDFTGVTKMTGGLWYQSHNFYIKGYWLFLFLLKLDEKLGVYVGVDWAKSGLLRMEDKVSVRLFLRLAVIAELRNFKSSTWEKKTQNGVLHSHGFGAPGAIEMASLLTPNNPYVNDDTISIRATVNAE